MRLLGAIVLLPALVVGGCAKGNSSKPDAKAAVLQPRKSDPRDIALPSGYKIEAVAVGLTYPTGVAFDAQNRPHVLEAGYSYGEDFRIARLLRLESNGSLVPVIASDQAVPWTGVSFRDGAFYIAQGGAATGGRVVRVNANGSSKAIIENLPSRGDHHTNGPAIGPDGAIYIGVGSATNSGVVGTDTFKFGWLKRSPDFRDIPAKDIKLVGKNFKTDNPLSPANDDKAQTGAFSAFGTATQKNQVVPGAMPCNGAILRIGPEGGEPQLVAWGLRNPFGLRFGSDGMLYVTENQYDDRGSRPVWGAGDLLWKIDPKKPPLWYGWPDFHGGQPLTWKDHYQPGGKPAPERLLAENPNDPPRANAFLPVHAAAGGLDLSRNEAFGHVGEAFVALFGDQTPSVGKAVEPVGFQVVRVNPSTGVIHGFAMNKGSKNGPASKLAKHGLERPLDARFDNTGQALYVVDFGVLIEDKSGSHPQPGTGVLWRITRGGAK